MKRIDWLDTAKGISIVLVVFWHAIMAARSLDFVTAAIYPILNAPLLLIRMPLFFSVSGVVTGGKPRLEPASFFHKRAWPTLWPYILWTAVYVIVQGRPTEQLLQAIYDPQFHLWFLWALLLFRSLAWLLDGARLAATLVALAVSVIAFTLPTHTFSLAHTNFLKYAFFFLAGHWYGRALAEFTARHAFAALAAGIAIASVSWIAGFWFGVALSGVLAGWSLAKIITDHAALLCRLFTWLGQHSLEIFILHFMMVGPLTRITMLLPGSAYWGIPVVTGAAVVLSVILRKISDPFAPWLFQPPTRSRRLSSTGSAG